MAAAASVGGGSVMPAVVENGPAMPAAMPAVVEPIDNSIVGKNNVKNSGYRFEVGDIVISSKGPYLFIGTSRFNKYTKQCEAVTTYRPLKDVKEWSIAPELNDSRYNVLTITFTDNTSYRLRDGVKFNGVNMTEEFMDLLARYFAFERPTIPKSENAELQKLIDEFFKINMYPPEFKRIRELKDLGYSFNNYISSEYICKPYTQFRAFNGIATTLDMLQWYIANPMLPYTESPRYKSFKVAVPSKAGGARKTRRNVRQRRRRTSRM